MDLSLDIYVIFLVSDIYLGAGAVGQILPVLDPQAGGHRAQSQSGKLATTPTCFIKVGITLNRTGTYFIVLKIVWCGAGVRIQIQLDPDPEFFHRIQILFWLFKVVLKNLEIYKII